MIPCILVDDDTYLCESPILDLKFPSVPVLCRCLVGGWTAAGVNPSEEVKVGTGN